MKGGDRWHVAASSDDRSSMNRILLRFRPIAPKPVAGSPAPENKGFAQASGKRRKRKYVRVRMNRRSREKEDVEVVDPRVEEEKIKIGMEDRTVETWVTVESVREERGGGGEYNNYNILGRTDEEKMKRLERDTCPGFISDGRNEVRWVNEAYKRMVLMVSGGEKEKENNKNKENRTSEKITIVVWLKMKDEEVYNRDEFTCKVRVEYNNKRQNGKYCTRIVPCDVWRMDSGGFAWRLDVQAALTLGIS